MAIIKRLREYTPIYQKNCWFAETAVIIGQVTMDEQCTVWYNAVLRGDVNFIKMGDKVNVQDNAVIHGSYQKASTTIGNNVSIGHNAIVHGCTLENNVLIGMGAIVMDNAVVKEGAIIAAGAVVSAGTIIPEGEVYGGIPARKLKEADKKNKEMIQRIANNYPMYASWYQEHQPD